MLHDIKSYLLSTAWRDTYAGDELKCQLWIDFLANIVVVECGRKMLFNIPNDRHYILLSELFVKIKSNKDAAIYQIGRTFIRELTLIFGADGLNGVCGFFFFFIRIRSHAALKVSVGLRNIFLFLLEVNICYDQCPSSACAIGMELILTKITPPSW